MREAAQTRAAPAERARKKEEKRMRILEAALKIFSQKGYVPAALDDVARAADVAKGTLYLYFRDKEDLFASTIMFVVDRLAERLRNNVRESMDPLEVLRLLAYHQLDFFTGNRDFFCVFHNILQENLLKKHKKLISSLHKRTDELLEFISSVVERGKNEGLIRGDLPTVDIVHCFGGMVMHMSRTLFQPSGAGAERFDAAEKARSIVRIFFEGVATKRAADGARGSADRRRGVAHALGNTKS